MNILDGIIIVTVTLFVLRGVHIGLTRRVFSFTGFWLGFFGGAYASIYLIPLFQEPVIRFMSGVIVILGSAVFVGAFGKKIGDYFASRVKDVKLRGVDVVLGGLFDALLIIGIFWLLSSVFSGVPVYDVNRHISQSSIIQAVHNRFPPAPEVLARVTRYINSEAFPPVFIGPEPRPVGPQNPPETEEVAAALATAGTSTVRIESAGCGGIVFGSGFIAADDAVVTNAHVVAGISSLSIVDIEDRHSGEIVYFDPAMDIAIIRVSGLAGEPLELDTDRQPAGTTATTLGYPSGGELEPSPTVILRQLDARGRDIYDSSRTTRSIYELQTSVTVGNSGGPVVLRDGSVVGMIFARSDAHRNTGYAITADKIAEKLAEAAASDEAVDNGVCVQPQYRR